MIDRDKKVCPQMSDSGNEIECCEHRCVWWIEVYTTEGLRIDGCAIALQPRMVGGEVRV